MKGKSAAFTKLLHVIQQHVHQEENHLEGAAVLALARQAHLRVDQQGQYEVVLVEEGDGVAKWKMTSTDLLVLQDLYDRDYYFVKKMIDANHYNSDDVHLLHDSARHFLAGGSIYDGQGMIGTEESWAEVSIVENLMLALLELQPAQRGRNRARPVKPVYGRGRSPRKRKGYRQETTLSEKDFY
ncbi:unnamed protein product [Amoebophrya sp. A25]|nr:unnamed protein product [Amoebophrya sp. A25]|eukprot:GSA25T00018657001.1